MLGDLGADVIKVERPGVGDEARGYGPALGGKSEGAMFVSANRNKRSVAIDLSLPAGQALVRDLIARSDVLIENYKAGTLAAYGLDHEAVALLNPQLVYCSITGFGQQGPYAQRPGYDTLFQAQSGMMSLTGMPDGAADGGPLRVGFAMVDVMVAHQAVIAIQAALIERSRSGQGQTIDMALLDGAIAALSHVAQGWLFDGRQPPRLGNGAGAGAGPAEVLQCSDGPVYVTAPSDALFRRLSAAIGRAELASDARFLTSRLRAAAREELRHILTSWTQTRPRDVVVETLVAAGVPAGPVNDLGQALSDPHALAHQVTVPAPHPHDPAMKLLASPLHLARTPPRVTLPPPLLGQHTDEVLQHVLGIDAQTVAALRREGVVA